VIDEHRIDSLRKKREERREKREERREKRVAGCVTIGAKRAEFVMHSSNDR
jgi:hypothetical protein